jgi:superfamily II DNA or RNA helicase
MDFTISVGAIMLKLTPRASDYLIDLLQTKISYRPKGYQYTHLYKQGVWDGRKKLFRRTQQIAPSGCYRSIKKLLEKEGHTVKIIFEKAFNPSGSGNVKELTPYEFQSNSAKLAIENKYCIIEAPVRAGKTLIFSLILSKLDKSPAFVITYGKDLVLQTKKELERFLERSIGFFSEGKFKEGEIIVTSYQALSRVWNKNKTSEAVRKRNKEIQDLVSKSNIVILDECQYAFSEKSRKFIEQFRNVGYRVGLSGTVRPDGISKMEMESVIGPVVLRVPFDKLISIGRIAQPIIHMYDLPYKWFREHLWEYNDIYEANIVQNYYRNRFIKKIVEKLKETDKTSYVMVRRKAHGEELQNLIPNSVYVYGDIKSSVRKNLYENLQNGVLSCIIATVGKVGLNLPKLDAVINAEGLEASTITIQKMRSLTATENKSRGLVIDFVDKGKYLYDHSARRLSIYKKKKGFIIKEKKVPKNAIEESD